MTHEPENNSFLNQGFDTCHSEVENRARAIEVVVCTLAQYVKLDAHIRKHVEMPVTLVSEVSPHCRVGWKVSIAVHSVCFESNVRQVAAK